MSLLLALALAADAADRVETLRILADADARVAAIGYRLAVANVERCADRAPVTGLLLHAREQYAPAYRAAAARLFGLGDSVEVAAVVPGSPADRAGLKASDALVGEPARRDGYARVGAMLDRLDPQAIRLADGRVVRLEMITGCAARFQVAVSRRRNARAGTGVVEINTALLALARDDDEVSAIIAHELAHLILGHRGRRGRQLELDADALGLQLMRGAAYRPEAAPAFWRREGRKLDAGIFTDPSHPRWKTRARRLDQALAAMPK